MTTSPVARITDEQLAELERALAGSPTPGPWWVISDDCGNEIDSHEGPIVEHTSFSQDEDMAFIAAANPACIASLIARLRAAEKDAARYRWLRDRAGVDFAFGDFMVFLHSGNYEISDQDKINTDQSIDAAIEKQP